ncbi:hypothetical protein ElyMa_004614600 [Elysia marginata]|uniref:Uncharacterized protein n=1 Tax=Elysia marginata TaxID=1093978 RepID=A0AAV4I220_9GAST|nr:hypothetical protein ElyMa_004614600 [Elysia marginata]
MDGAYLKFRQGSPSASDAWDIDCSVITLYRHMFVDKHCDQDHYKTICQKPIDQGSDCARDWHKSGRSVHGVQ